MAIEISGAQAVTLAIALLGALLGVVNTWSSLTKDELRLKIVPAHAIPVIQGQVREWTLSIEVINLSTFPVTIDEVGLRLAGTRDRIAVMSPRLTNGQTLPYRLQPREAASVIVDPEVRWHARMRDVVSAYARCQCGTVRYGTSPALRQLARAARTGENPT